MVIIILMNNISFGNKRLIGEFVQCYVERAFELAEQGLPSQDFYDKLFNSVAEDCGLSKKVILALHHPFHWAFFNSYNGSSPFQLVYTGKLDNIQYVKLTKDSYTERERQEDILSMSNEIIDIRGNTLISKMENLSHLIKQF